MCVIRVVARGSSDAPRIMRTLPFQRVLSCRKPLCSYQYKVHYFYLRNVHDVRFICIFDAFCFDLLEREYPWRHVNEVYLIRDEVTN